MPFSRSRTRDGLDDLLASCAQPSSRLLRLMSEYGIDTTPSSAATVTSSSLAPTSSPVKLLRPSCALARAHARAAPEEAAEVVRLGQRALGPGRGHLERVLAQQVAQVLGDPLAEREIDPVRVVDRTSVSLPPGTRSASSTSTSGSALASRCSMYS